ncbi:unnamed protein product [Mortierella alpina]
MRNRTRLALFLALALALSLGICHGQGQIQRRCLYQRRQDRSSGSEDIDTPVQLGPFPLRRYRHLMHSELYHKRAEPSESVPPADGSREATPASIASEPTHSEPPPLTPSTTDASSAVDPTTAAHEESTAAATSSPAETTTTTTSTTTTTIATSAPPRATTTVAETTATTTSIPTTIATTAITTTAALTTTDPTTTTTTTTTTTITSVPIVSSHTSRHPIRTSDWVSKTDPTTEAVPTESSDVALKPSGSSSVGDTNKTGITIGVAIGSVVVAAGIGVWIFRKWKLSPSRQFKSKIRSSVGGSIGASRADDHPDDYEMYSDIFRPAVHDSGFPAVVAASSMAGSSPQMQHMHYEQQPYDEHEQQFAPSEQQQQSQEQHMSASTVTDYGQYRQQGGQERWLDEGYGYDAVVNEAIIGSSGPYYPSTYASQESGAPNDHFLRELRE